jgi:multiple antibiotic resistance protein
VATYIILRVAPRLVGYLGQSGITSLTRIMGFITLSLGVQFIAGIVYSFHK